MGGLCWQAALCMYLTNCCFPVLLAVWKSSLFKYVFVCRYYIILKCDAMKCPISFITKVKGKLLCWNSTSLHTTLWHFTWPLCVCVLSSVKDGAFNVLNDLLINLKWIYVFLRAVCTHTHTMCVCVHISLKNTYIEYTHTYICIEGV